MGRQSERARRSGERTGENRAPAAATSAPSLPNLDVAATVQGPQPLQQLQRAAGNRAVVGALSTRGPAVQRTLGVVKWFDPTKGYGFASPRDGGKDVFVPVTALQQAGIRGVEEGQQVSYSVAMQQGKAVAADLRLI